ncbi:MAG: Holliday junction resolvase RuvX [Coleofasciculaceae cyanobacterium SM2_1_6]|nr:Holliday junction resolvase RuvX [Coleofasciculaceae cyanobacterium SM2_1_6]
MKKRVAALGLDLGKRRIGVAGCDGLGMMATGLTTIRRTSFPADIAALQKLVKEREVEILVVGLPYHLDGTLSAGAEQIQKLAKRIGKALQLPIEYVNESLTSYEAEEMMRSQGIRVLDHQEMIDRKAAAIILQQWLNETAQKSQKSQNSPSAPNPQDS